MDFKGAYIDIIDMDLINICLSDGLLNKKDEELLESIDRLENNKLDTRDFDLLMLLYKKCLGLVHYTKKARYGI